jgi:predicted metalloprotease with PDZ domain
MTRRDLICSPLRDVAPRKAGRRPNATKARAILIVALFSTTFCFAAAAATTPLSEVPPTGQTQCNIKIVLLPKEGSASVESAEVDIVFAAIHVAPGDPLVQLALIADNVDTVATTLTDLNARDAKGPLKLTSRDVTRPIEAARDSEAGGPTRQWFADRAPQGAVTIHYKVPAMATLPPRGPTGPLAFSNDADGASAAGNVFLLMPVGSQKYDVTMAWDVSHLKPGAFGVTSLGEGVAVSAVPMSSAELRESYFMGGALHRWPHGQTAKDFFAAWQGTPPFDAPSLMRWAKELHQYYSRFFGRNSDRPYGVFMRYNPVNAGGGTGFFHSFVLTFGAGVGADVASLKSMLAHEMFHTFQPYISIPAGNESSWFAEGLAVLYEGKLPLRYRMITPDAFLKNLNNHASRYYSSVKATEPNNEAAAHFWDDTLSRTLAYDRAMLYFATIDDAVRKKSNGKRSLDTLVLRLLALEDTGSSLRNDDWENVLRSELGDDAVSEFHASLNGKMPVPAPDAFGPCYTRTTARARRYEIGFEPAVLREPRRIVRGLVPGSAAGRAGLQDGDEIVKPVPQDEIQGNQTELLKLDIRRGDREFKISYLPRGEEVDVYQWKRVPLVPDKQCGI